MIRFKKFPEKSLFSMIKQNKSDNWLKHVSGTYALQRYSLPTYLNCKRIMRLTALSKNYTR